MVSPGYIRRPVQYSRPPPVIPLPHLSSIRPAILMSCKLHDWGGLLVAYYCGTKGGISTMDVVVFPPKKLVALSQNQNPPLITPCPPFRGAPRVGAASDLRPTDSHWHQPRGCRQIPSRSLAYSLPGQSLPRGDFKDVRPRGTMGPAPVRNQFSQAHQEIPGREAGAVFERG